jgi:hypothetical protein
MITHRRLVASLLAAAGLISAVSAQPDLSDVSFVTRQLSGKTYYEVTAIMNGAPSSPYRVPIVLLYPLLPSERNGTAIVDYVNNTAMRFRAADTAGSEYEPTTPIARVLLGDEFIGEYGYTYVAIQWDRDILPIVNFNEGTAYAIPRERDQLSVVFDVALLLQQPPAVLPGAFAAVTNRLAFGYSASAFMLHGLLEHPVLRSAFSSAFDGVLLGSGGRLSTPSIEPHGAPSGWRGSQQGGTLKTIFLQGETEPQILDSASLRGQSADYRCYEIAGASHNPTSLIDLNRFIGLPGVSLTIRQNPLDTRPVYRAMMEHLRSWTRGTGTPPPSASLGNPFNTHNNIDFTPASLGVEHIDEIPRSSSDGNALGGIRLPSIVVPVGFHNGLETIAGMPYSFTTFGQMISGKFVPYSTTELNARYPTHAAYVQAVTTAADAALAAGWILASDRDAYVATAQACLVGTGIPLTYAQILECFRR